MPIGMDMDQWSRLFKKQGVVFYDSKQGEKPFYTQPNPEIKMYDVQEEKAMAELESILADDDIKYGQEPSIPPSATDLLITLDSGTGSIGSGDLTIGHTATNVVSTTTGETDGTVAARPYGHLTTERIEQALEEIFTNPVEVVPSNPTDLTAWNEQLVTELREQREVVTEDLEQTEVSISNLLTSSDVDALEVIDPRGENPELSQAENNLINDTMATQIAPVSTPLRIRTTTSRSRGPSSPSFELTDDTV